MKLQIILELKAGPEVTSETLAHQLAACTGFAHQLQVPMRIVPDGGAAPSARRVNVPLSWGDKKAVRPNDMTTFSKAKSLMSDGSNMLRKDFIHALAKELKKPNREVGVLVSKWVKDGVLVEA